MADAVKIPVEARDPAKNKGTGTRVAAQAAGPGPDPGDHLRAQAGPRADLAGARRRLADDQEVDPPGRALRSATTSEMVLVRDVQWDHLGKEIIHLDFARVSADESIETEVRLELHGTAPGVGEGGVLEQLVHSVDGHLPGQRDPRLDPDRRRRRCTWTRASTSATWSCPRG